jgi:peroxiredoxin
MSCSRVILGLLYSFAAIPSPWAFAQESSEYATKPGAAPGHSVHAEAFNEGPRQAAYLMRGMGNVHWQTTTPSPMAQRFFDQGLAQLHGFWYFEAERSFRQAASIDPECAIHYWGMARANAENPKRSEGFIQQAIRRLESASKIERRLIEAWRDRVQDWPEESTEKNEEKVQKNSKQKRGSKSASEDVRNQRKERLKKYAKELEEISLDYRDDVEVKAMLVLQYWQNQSEGIDIQSYAAIDALLSEIFRLNPKHAAHHFRIHLWDYRKEELALSAAADCGPSAPGIAHMWHMPGHTYSRLHRYADAAWQQEASARVDHAHMMRDVIMPDQIHNYAHNNEWLIRNWMFLGRIDDAIGLSMNMIELPRHPEYNAIDGTGSASYGRQRLLAALSNYQRWEQMLELCDSPYLKDSDDAEDSQDTTLVWKGISLAQLGNIAEAANIRGQIASMRSVLRQSLTEIDEANALPRPVPPLLLEPFDPPADLLNSENDRALPQKVNREFDDGEWKDKAVEDRERARKKHLTRYRYYRLGGRLAALDAHLAASRGEYRAAVRLSHEARDMIEPIQRLEWCSMADSHELAIQKSTDLLNSSKGQVLPAALTAWVADRAILALPSSPSIDAWKETRKKAVQQCADLVFQSDSKIPLIERARSVAQESHPEIEWGKQPTKPKDLGDRPSLNSLGPLRWDAPAAPIWGATGVAGEDFSSKRMAGKPYVLILYLGFGCLHCAEQLGKFSPAVDRFREAGIEVIGVSTETPQSLAEGLKRYDREMRISLASNASLDVFKAFRCFDDFEGQALHGTIFVDGEGRIRWQDIGHEPFMDAEFLLQEARRLLRISEFQNKRSEAF